MLSNKATTPTKTGLNSDLSQKSHIGVKYFLIKRLSYLKLDHKPLVEDDGVLTTPLRSSICIFIFT